MQHNILAYVTALTVFITMFVITNKQVLAQQSGYEPVCALSNILPEDFVSTKIRGLTIAPIENGQLGDVGYGSKPCAQTILQAAQMGATWVSITPFGRMDDLDSTDILHDFEIPVLKNEEMIHQTIEFAKNAGLKVAIIPHVYIMSGRWRGEIDPGSDANWKKWFKSYEDFVLRFARLANLEDVDLFSIGVEFKSSTNFREQEWRKIISKISKVYKGPLTYSANWDEADQVPFWDQLDFIGINAFWPLAKEPGDGFEVMIQHASDVANSLDGLSFYYDKPILFTEMGVKSSTDAALAPWEWPEHCSAQNYNEQYQAKAYEAVFDIMTRRWWFAGMFIWKYFSDPYDETQENITGFSPKGKQAENVLAKWFKKSWK